jgi:hypothetical protein
MTQHFTSRAGLTTFFGLGLLLTCCVSRPASTTATPPVSFGGAAAAVPPADPWYLAMGEASQAAQMAATADTAAQWHQVVGAWGRSLALLQDIAPDDPRQGFSQRKAREYQQNLAQAQQRAEQQGLARVFPALGSDVLDEQVSLYHAYVATLGPPDVLILGSSRALQGIDPQVLQQALAVQGSAGLRVYNFSVNGATAQVVSFITRQLLAPDLQPRLIIWAEGSRGFNSGRFDRTFAEILASPGYAAVQEGARLTLQPPDGDGNADEAGETTADGEKADFGTVALTAINSQGFLAVNDQFNPAVYYRSFPLVRGQYDNAYRPFRLEGVQTVSFEATTQFLQAQDIPLVFVNLPLSNDYLDSVRLGYERQFQRFLQSWARQDRLILIDMLEDWRWRSHLFADPSHINRYGAREMASQLAADRRIPWPQALAAE